MKDAVEAFRAEVGAERIPRHVAIIMDGNGRWATRRGQVRVLGHRKGAAAVRETIRTASELGLESLTLYAFSRENWARPPEEVRALMTLIRRYVRRELEEIDENGIRLRIIGRMSELPPEVLRDVTRAMERTAGNRGMTLNIALSYSGRSELADAARALARRVAAGEIAPDDIDEDRLDAELTTAGQPDPDLLVRTGGELRVSNFLLWQLAYTELYVTDTLWPDFGRDALFEAIRSFASRERRFGKTSAQLAEAQPAAVAPLLSEASRRKSRAAFS